MPAYTKKRPLMEPEAGESKAHEAGESPDEEIREGSEGEESRVPTNRRRSAKGSKNTKAPMDGEGCGCGGGKGKKCSCNDGCGSYSKMDAALTPQEYLSACDLGIQHRSRSYIRARLDASERLDKKCGGSGIADNKKCNKGSSGSAFMGTLAGAALIGGSALAAKSIHSAIETANANKEALNRINRLRTKGPGGREAARSLLNQIKEGVSDSRARERKVQANRKALPPASPPVQRRVRRHGKVVRMNSMYADGFTPNYNQL